MPSRENLTRRERAEALFRALSGAVEETAFSMGASLLPAFMEGWENLSHFGRELEQVRREATVQEIARVTGMSTDEARERLDCLTTMSIGGLDVHLVQNRACPPTEVHLGNVRVVNLQTGDEAPATAEELRQAGERVQTELSSDFLGTLHECNGVLSWEVRNPCEGHAQTETEGLSMPSDPPDERQRPSFMDAMRRILRERRAPWVSARLENVVARDAPAGDVAATQMHGGTRFIHERLSQDLPPGVASVDDMTEEEVREAMNAAAQQRGDEPYIWDGVEHDPGHYTPCAPTWAEISQSILGRQMTSDEGAFVEVDWSPSLNAERARRAEVICAGHYQEYLDFCREYGIDVHAEGAPLYAGPTREAREALTGYRPERIIVIGTYEQALRARVELDALRSETPGLDRLMNAQEPRFMPDPDRPGDFITIDESHEVPLHIAMDEATDWNPSAAFTHTPSQTRWERMYQTAHDELIALGMESADFETFWAHAKERFEANRSIIWNLEPYLRAETAVKRAELEGKDLIETFLCHVRLDGVAAMRLSIAYMNHANIDNYAQAREMAMAHADMLRWT